MEGEGLQWLQTKAVTLYAINSFCGISVDIRLYSMRNIHQYCFRFFGNCSIWARSCHKITMYINVVYVILYNAECVWCHYAHGVIYHAYMLM